MRLTAGEANMKRREFITFSPPTLRRGDRMKRREVIALLGGAAAAWPVAASAQQMAALIGFLVSGAADSFAIFVEAFKQGMRDNRMVEGRGYVLDLRYADGDGVAPADDVTTRLPSLGWPRMKL